MGLPMTETVSFGYSEVTPAEKDHLALFGERDYEIDGLPYHMSTQVWMTE